MATDVQQEKFTSSVYGPVQSWRVGKSLGIDLLLQNSICSFNCIYCQLGDIQVKTAERKIYVSTEQLEKDFKHSNWQEADIITLSGNGEPTLALNMGEVIHFIKEYSGKPVMVLTNATLLRDPAVVRDLQEADIVAAKLDATNDQYLQMMNRPVSGITMAGIVEGIKNLRANYRGKLCLQCMFMPANVKEAEQLAALINEINPDEVQLNTPKRPYPTEWHVESRGNHPATEGAEKEIPARVLKVLSQQQADDIEACLKKNTNVPIVSVYRK